jgi:hypothetical protein
MFTEMSGPRDALLKRAIFNSTDPFTVTVVEEDTYYCRPCSEKDISLWNQVGGPNISANSYQVSFPA